MKKTTTFTSLPTELHLAVCELLPDICSINALLQTNRYFAQLLDNPLYQHACKTLYSPAAKHQLDFIITRDLGPTLSRLISLGLPTGLPPYTSWSILDTAAALGKPNILRAYFNAGIGLDLLSDCDGASYLRTTASPHLDWPGATLLHPACTINDPGYPHYSVEGVVEVVRLLIAQGVDVNRVDFKGNSALQLAVDCFNLPVVRVLMENGADPSRIVFNPPASLKIQEIVGICREYYKGDVGFWDPETFLI